MRRPPYGGRPVDSLLNRQGANEVPEKTASRIRRIRAERRFKGSSSGNRPPISEAHFFSYSPPKTTCHPLETLFRNRSAFRPASSAVSAVRGLVAVTPQAISAVPAVTSTETIRSTAGPAGAGVTSEKTSMPPSARLPLKIRPRRFCLLDR